MHQKIISYVNRILAMTCVFTLTFSNIAFVCRSYATSLSELFSNEKTHENIIFDAYFKENENQSKEVISSVNNSELQLSLNLNVEREGYLKNAKIELYSPLDEKLNFELDEKNLKSIDVDSDIKGLSGSGIVLQDGTKNADSEKDRKFIEYIENYDNGVIDLKQLNASSNVHIDIPISYKNDEYISQSLITNDTSIKLSGIYVDNDGEEHEIEETQSLKLSWTDERALDVSSKVLKYVDYENGIVLQTLVKVDNSTDKKTLPVANSELEIDVPEIDGILPEKVNVSVISLQLTNGEEPENTKFNKENWSYDIENKKLKIEVENNEVTKNFYNESLTGLKSQEYSSKYYNGTGSDEYVITYIYKDITSKNHKFTAHQNVKAMMNILSGDNGLSKIENEKSEDFILENQDGEIASLDVENLTEELSKSYFYANYSKIDTYDLSIVTKYIMNVANKDLVENMYFEDVQNFYIDKSGNMINNNDLSYKELVVNRANFEEILGVEGQIKIYDANDKSIIYGLIDKNSIVDSNGDMTLFVNGKIDRIRIEVSKPINEGNLIVKTTKGLGNLSIPKEQLLNIDSILTRTDFNVKYSDIDEIINVGTKNTITKLLDTKTMASIVIGKEKLSTLTENENVDIKIELNNDDKQSDLYGHSEFTIDYPSYVDNIEVTNTSILYGEGLDISYVKNQDRKIIVAIDGIQKELNSGILTNGTNIVLTTNIKVSEFAPMKYDSFKMTYTNDEATSYENNLSEAYVKYFAPSGLVAVNTVRNYKDNDNYITSVRQGTKTELINTYQNSRTASTELLIMNNNENTVSNISIIGSFPYKGMKDYLTGEDMGNTRDIEVMPIIAGENDGEEFEILYSNEENPEENSSSWVSDFYSLNKVKSFMIKPINPNYAMLKADTLEFSYDFVIPANLGHGEKIISTYKVEYDNNTENGVLHESSYPDIVSIMTEDGPEVEMHISTDKEDVYEGEELYVSYQIMNKGNRKLSNLNFSVPFPENVSYISYYTANENSVNIENMGDRLKVTTLELKENQDLIFDVTYKANSSKYFEDENGKNIAQDDVIDINASLEASGLGSIIKASPVQIKIKKAELVVSEDNIDSLDDATYKVGNEIPIGLSIRNISDSEISNIKIQKEIPEGLDIVSIKQIIDEEEQDISSNIRSGVVEIALDKISPKSMTRIEFVFKVNNVQESVISKRVKFKSTIKANDKEYESNEVIATIAKSQIQIVQETDSSNTYIKENGIVNYIVKVKNVGGAIASGIKFEDVVPDCMTIVSYSYANDGIQYNNNNVVDGTIKANLVIKPNEEVVFNIKVQATGNLDSIEKSATNIARVDSVEQGTVTSNSITHIIEKSEEEVVEQTNEIKNEEKVISNDVPVEETRVLGKNYEAPTFVQSEIKKENIERTYKINGNIWEDINKDGIKEIDEGKIDDYNDMKVILVNAENGVVLDTQIPDSTGNYLFQGVRNGEYYIILDYNTKKYGITTYRKDGVSEIVNSDIISSKVEENGIQKNTAVTDKFVVNNQSISNVDMGLFYADVYDMEISSMVSQIMIQTSHGMTTTTFDNEKLAKEEIVPNDLDGSTAYIEYTIKVMNKGAIPGYIKRIVSYKADNLEFNSGLEANTNWYSGANKNIYTNCLSNVEIKPGESREVKLLLEKKMTEDNTGLINNQFEIAEDYNIYGISDIDSVPGNRVQAEDDMSIADSIITLATGEKIVYTIFIVIGVSLVTVTGYVVNKKIKLVKNKEEEDTIE